MTRDDKLRWGILIACALAGACFGFLKGGIGGAIVFTAVGTIVGFLAEEILVVVVGGGLLILAVGLGLAAIIFAIRLIYSLWGVGRP